MALNPQNIKNKGFDKHPENINRKGRPPVLPPLKEAIEKIMNEEKDGKTALDAVLLTLRSRAIKGDMAAIKELLDRYYGKAVQKVEAKHEGEVKQTIIVTSNPDNVKKLVNDQDNESI